MVFRLLFAFCKYLDATHLPPQSGPMEFCPAALPLLLISFEYACCLYTSYTKNTDTDRIQISDPAMSSLSSMSGKCPADDTSSTMSSPDRLPYSDGAPHTSLTCYNCPYPNARR